MAPAELAHARESLYLSRLELAVMLGVSDSTVAHWEQGVQRIPPYLRLALIGAAVERALTALPQS